MRPIPSPKGLPALGTILSLLASGGAPKLHLYVDRRHKELGPIYREKIGPVSGVFIADGHYMRKIFAFEGKYPRHVIPESWLLYNKIYGCKRGLLFMDGEEWLSYRKIMNNIMLKVSQAEFSTASNIVAEDLIENWRHQGKITNLEKELYKWSLEVMVAVLLGADNYMKNKNELSPSIQNLSQTVHQIFVESATLSLIPVKIAFHLKLPVWKRFVLAASSTIDQGKIMIEKILEMEKKNPDAGSFISKMLRTGMDVQNLKRIVTDMILAAGDTTAHAMQWLLHYLSMDLTCQELIYNELRELPEEDILQSTLLKGALKEALRLCPVAPFLTRFMPEDLTLDGYQIKAEELVLMSLYSSGRNEKYFPRPNSFWPQRWVRNDKTYEGVNNPNATLPFAMGARSCIGKKIAETQILITMSKILQNFVLKSDRKNIIDIRLHLIAVPAEKITLNLVPRNKN